MAPEAAYPTGARVWLGDFLPQGVVFRVDGSAPLAGNFTVSESYTDEEGLLVVGLQPALPLRSALRAPDGVQ